MDSLYVVMPTYNEQLNIKSAIKAWYPVLDGKADNSRLVVADSGSTDSTHEILVRLQRDYPRLVILSNTKKKHGPKVIALYNYAIKNGIDYVFQTDSDEQTNPAEFEEFWNLREQYDGIFGYRNEREDGKFRIFVEYVVCFLLRVYFGIEIPDANAPFRMMKTEILKKYLYKLPFDYNLPNIMITAFFVYYKESYIFRTISFKQRQNGLNSIDVWQIFKIGWRTLWDFRRFKKGIKAYEK